MECIKISGKRKLCGSVKIQGSKNTALPIIAAALLNKGVTVLHNCPDILDVHRMIDILEELGCKIDFKDNVLTIDASNVQKCDIASENASEMRASILMAGALAGRCHRVKIPYPGGCVIGKRPIDIHLDIFKKLGMKMENMDDTIIFSTDNLKGTYIKLKFPSVGATENAVLAAVLAKGTTTIENCAIEPEIICLCDFLKKAGALIYQKKNRVIMINGVEKLNDTQYHIASDRIVAGTYMLAAAASRSNISLENVPYAHMTSQIETFKKLGMIFETDHNDNVIVHGENAYKSIKYIKTMIYPGFPTDMQPQIMAVLTMAFGNSIISESIFESRYNIAKELNKMGAKIIIQDGEKSTDALIYGPQKLKGAVVNSCDLRAGAALVIAGIAAQGDTIIKNSTLIDRGYEDICYDMTQLGASISRINL